jgi:hypothetical protein
MEGSSRLIAELLMLIDSAYPENGSGTYLQCLNNLITTHDQAELL